MTQQEEVERLVASFVAAAKGHYEATMDGEASKVNREAKKISASFQKIAAMGDPGRQALLACVHSDDLAVASMAAAYSLKYDPEQSLKALRRIAKEPGIIGFEAKHALKRWEEGNWQIG